MGQHCPVDTARGAQVEILDAGGLSEGCELEPGGHPFAIAFGVRREIDPPDRFLARLTTVDQQTEAILEAQRFKGGICATLFIKRLGHASQPKGDEPLGGGVGQQGCPPFNDSSLDDSSLDL